MNPKTTEPCYAIIRVESDGCRTVKLIAWSQTEADGHVDRLNALNADKGCRYHVETTRALRRPV